MSSNPAKDALGLNTDDSASGNKEAIDALEQLTSNNSKITTPVSDEQVPASSTRAKGVEGALSVTLPLICALLEENVLDTKDFNDVLDAMLDSVHKARQQASSSLAESDFDVAASQPALTELCVYMVSSFWQISGDSPDDIYDVIVHFLNRIKDIEISQAPIIEQATSTMDVIALLVRKGEYSNLDSHIPVVINCVTSSADKALELFGYQVDSNPTIRVELQRASSKLLCEIIKYDHISYLSNIRRSPSNTSQNGHHGFDISSSIRRHSKIWDSYIIALCESMNEVFDS